LVVRAGRYATPRAGAIEIASGDGHDADPKSCIVANDEQGRD
jgi:hypothetical protein